MSDSAHSCTTPEVPCAQAITRRGAAGCASRGATTMPVTSIGRFSSLRVQ
ncbi:hypothetical protein J4558_21105 [Leptolyngbya sp. 15MV]|nr:hypothetical protein J4558_21105 [Leptolyngbya sp. 15MV]